MSFQAIGIREIETYLNRPNTSLIDLCSREEYELCHFEGARNIPYDELFEHKQYLSKKNSTFLRIITEKHQHKDRNYNLEKARK